MSQGLESEQLDVLVLTARKALQPGETYSQLLCGDGVGRNPFDRIPSGWMGDTGAIALNEQCPGQPLDGATCIEARFRQGGGWGGVVWQHPVNDWGDLPGGFDLSGAKSLTFYARGDRGDEKVKFGFGLITADKP